MRGFFLLIILGLEPMRKLLAEAAGTFAFVAVICCATMIPFSAMGADSTALNVAIGAGFCIAAMTYAVGPVSGGHFNPAITCGLCAAGRFPVRGVLSYVLAQLTGATLAAVAVYIFLSSKIGWSPNGFAANGYAAHSPGGYSAVSALAAEVILGAILVFVFCRMTGGRHRLTLIAPLVIGLTVTALHLVSMPITNTSLNPARSTATALFAESWAIEQLWMFWLAPLLGALAGGAADRIIGKELS